MNAVAVLIGANNYGFADIVQTCITDWLTSPSWWPNYCYDDSSIKSRFTSARVATETANIRGAILNVRQAMANAGYADSQYTIIVQTYSSPIPRGSGFRYPQSGFTRQTIGGCGVWNRDADWANDTVVPTFNNSVRNAAAQTGLSNVKVLDMTNALAGRRLCENTVGLLEERGVANWLTAGAVDKTEWVSQIRTVTAIFGPVPAPGGRPPELLGPAGAAQLPAPGVQRRRAARRYVHDRRARADEPRRAGDELRLSWVARWHAEHNRTRPSGTVELAHRDRRPRGAARRQANAAVRGTGARRHRRDLPGRRDALRRAVVGADDPGRARVNQAAARSAPPAHSTASP